ncbi:hypothetical protein II654_01535, partial [bacterium]|nr:hypothetical protein [bacterium]
MKNDDSKDKNDDVVVLALPNIIKGGIKEIDTSKAKDVFEVIKNQLKQDEIISNIGIDDKKLLKIVANYFKEKEHYRYYEDIVEQVCKIIREEILDNTTL